MPTSARWVDEANESMPEKGGPANYRFRGPILIDSSGLVIDGSRFIVADNDADALALAETAESPRPIEMFKWHAPTGSWFPLTNYPAEDEADAPNSQGP